MNEKLPCQEKHIRHTIMIPAYIMTIYLIVTLFLFLWGPIEYYGAQKVYATLFMVTFLIIACFFYYLGIHQRVRKQRVHFIYGREKIVRFSIAYSFIIQSLLVLQNSIVQGISLTSVFRTGISDLMAETYTDISIVNTPASWVLSYTTWIRVIAFACGSYFGFKKERKLYKYLYIATLLLYTLNVVLFVGSQKQLIDLIPYVLVPFIVRMIKEQAGLPIKRFVPLFLGIMILVFMIGNNIQARRELWANRYNSTTQISLGALNTNHWLFKILPFELAMVFVQFIGYISQGYYGLSLCLQLPFEWSKGVGFSFKLMNDISKWLNIPLHTLENSYPVRMQEVFGIKAYAYWHTVFPWWASDVSWFGAVFIVSLFIFYWGKAWKEILTCESIPSIIMFSQLSLFIMYIPCNNQLFQDRGSFVCTLGILVIWLLYHGRTKQET